MRADAVERCLHRQMKYDSTTTLVEKLFSVFIANVMKMALILCDVKKREQSTKKNSTSVQSSEFKGQKYIVNQIEIILYCD